MPRPYEHPPRPGAPASAADMNAWATARTLAEFGEVTARWYEGHIRSRYSYVPNVGPRPELEPYVPTLAALSRACFVVTGAQPGATPDNCGNPHQPWGRAAVRGLADEQFADVLEVAAARAQLTFIAHAPGTPKIVGSQVPEGVVAQRFDHQNCTWYGYCVSEEGIKQQHRHEFHPDLIATLQGSWQIAIIDPEWGRNSLLWPVLDRALSSK